MIRRAVLLFLAIFVLVAIVGVTMGAPNLSLLLVQAFAYAIIAVGLNVQWGYGGLFNIGIMGFIMLGGFALTFMAYPITAQFWG